MNNFNNQQNNQNQEQVNQPAQPQNKGLFSLPPSIMQFVPWIPLMLEMTTGQKIPQMSGSIGEIQQGIQAIQMTLGQIIQYQKNLDQRLTSLENNATNQFTNLSQEVKSIKSVRLTHDRERKQVDFNLQQADEHNKY
jgi:hypothetical protein